MRAFLFLLLLPAIALAQEATIEASGTADLRWVPPTLNSDGTPLTDLAGYRLYWGTASRTYTDSLPIDDAGRTSASVVLRVTQLETTFYFAMTALDADGNESVPSNEVTRTIVIEVSDTTAPAPPVIDATIRFTIEGCVVVGNPSATCTVVDASPPDLTYTSTAPSADSIHPQAPVGAMVEVDVLTGTDVRINANGSASAAGPFSIAVRVNGGQPEVIEWLAP